MCVSVCVCVCLCVSACVCVSVCVSVCVCVKIRLKLLYPVRQRNIRVWFANPISKKDYFKEANSGKVNIQYCSSKMAYWFAPYSTNLIMGKYGSRIRANYTKAICSLACIQT